MRVALKNDRQRFLISLSSSLLADIPDCFPIFLRIPLPWALWGKQDQKADQVGRNCRRFPVTPLPKAGADVTSDHWGLYPACSWKPPGMERVQPLWAATSTAQLSSWCKSFLLCSVNLFRFSLCLLFFCLLSTIQHLNHCGDPPLTSLQIINIYFKYLLLIATFTANSYSIFFPKCTTCTKTPQNAGFEFFPEIPSGEQWKHVSGYFFSLLHVIEKLPEGYKCLKRHEHWNLRVPFLLISPRF